MQELLLKQLDELCQNKANKNNKTTLCLFYNRETEKT